MSCTILYIHHLTRNELADQLAGCVGRIAMFDLDISRNSGYEVLLELRQRRAEEVAAKQEIEAEIGRRACMRLAAS